MTKPKTKVCAWCTLEKPIDAFHRSRTSKDGRQSRCISCGSLRDASRGFRNAEEMRIHSENVARFHRLYARKTLTESEIVDACRAGVPVALMGWRNA